jgi:hypothetical protein
VSDWLEQRDAFVALADSNRRWIELDKELPKNGAVVPIRVKDDDYKIEYADIAYVFDGKFYESYNHYCYSEKDSIRYVIAWKKTWKQELFWDRGISITERRKRMERK